MSGPDPIGTQPARRRLIAPVWHTVIVVVLFAGLAAAGAFSPPSPLLTEPARSHIALYLSLIAAEVGLIYLVRLGLRKGGTEWTTIIGPITNSVPSAIRDLLIAAVLWGLWIGIEIVVGRMTQNAPAISGLLPHSAVDRSLWIAVAVAAGIAEELTFRGYLLRQFEALTGNVWIALTLQAVVFSVAHGYEGMAACATIAVYGLLLGLVRLKTGNLRACIIAHAWTDIAAGLI